MAVLRCNGFPVLEATLSFPLAGAWTASLHVDAAEALGASVSLETDDGGLALEGTVYRGGLSLDGRVVAAVVGGAGGLATPVAARAYHGATASLVVADVLAEAGEILSETVDGAALLVELPRWIRAKGTATSALAAVVDHLGLAWRLLPDGSLWIGSETWPAAEVDRYVITTDRPELSRVTLGLDRPAALYPGTALDGRRVSYVEQIVSGGSVRAEVWFA